MQRAWIIGNGPSLIDTPLNLLKDEVSFACNRIHLIFDKTDWRPSYIVRGDVGGLKKSEEYDLAEELKLQYNLGIPMRLHIGYKGLKNCYGLARWFPKKYDEVFFPVCSHEGKHYGEPGCATSWHLPSICTGASTVHIAMQLAVNYGYGPLYLVGCDAGFGKGRYDHFDPRYYDRRGVVSSAMRNRDTIAAHEVAKKSCPVEIYNCTLGGELNMYPRMSIEEVLDGKWHRGKVKHG